MKKMICIALFSTFLMIMLFGCKESNITSNDNTETALLSDLKIENDVNINKNNLSSDNYSESSVLTKAITNRSDTVSYTNSQSGVSGSRPMILFKSLDEFVSWIENPNIIIDKAEDPRYGRDYTNSLYSDTNKMFVVDRFYLLPIVPDNFTKVVSISVSLWDINFIFADDSGNQCYFVYRTDGRSYNKENKLVETKDTDGSNLKNLIATKTYDDRRYFLANNDAGGLVHQYFDNYRCTFGIVVNDTTSIDSYPTKFDTNTDIAPIISKINFKKVSLPPLK